MNAWHVLVNADRTRRLVRGSVDPLPDGWTEVAAFDASSHEAAQVTGRYLVPFDIDTGRLHLRTGGL